MSKITPGLVSITFRSLSVSEIISLSKDAKLGSIEWGGDVHVPHGEVETAKAVSDQTREAGLEVAAYGSYYRVGASEQDGLDFQSVLNSAKALQAPCIRVWPGNRGSEDADRAFRKWVTEELRRISSMAGDAGINVVLEYHGGTLTDADASALQLLEEVNHPNCRTLWQPPNGQAFEDSLQGLKNILPWLENVHAFHWWPTARDRFPLAEGEDRWKEYLALAADCDHPFHVLLEFVCNDQPDQLVEDSKTLRRWIEELSVQ